MLENTENMENTKEEIATDIIYSAFLNLKETLETFVVGMVNFQNELTTNKNETEKIKAVLEKNNIS